MFSKTTFALTRYCVFATLFISTLFATESKSQCPTGTTVVAGDKCMILTWSTPPSPLPATFTATPTGGSATIYTYLSGLGTTASPANYLNGPNCSGGQSGYSGTMEIGGNTCNYTAGALLPVELVTFEIKKENKQVRLKWATASEIENEGFSIEKSGDGKSWDRIGWVPGNGTSSERNEYSFSDLNPLNGENYYRLVQHDFDGTISHSPTRLILNLDETKVVSVYPSPAKDVLYFKNSTDFEIEQVTIFNQFGQTVLQQFSPEKSIGLSELNAGIYIAELKVENQKFQQRFLIQ